MTKQHLNITLSFLVVGHTKFAPDQCFGLFKRAYRRERVSCLEDIVKTVNKSSTVNVAQLVGTQDGQVIVPMYVTGLHTFLSTFESSYESRSTTTFSSQSVLVASLRAPMQKHLRRRLIWYLVTVGLQVVISCLTRTMSTSMVSV